MLIIENSKYEKHIRYAANYLLRNIDTSDVYLYYGRKKPANFKGLFLQESDFWQNYADKNSLPTIIEINHKLVGLYGQKDQPDLFATTYVFLSNYLDRLGLQEHGYRLTKAWQKITKRAVVDEYELYLLNLLRKKYQFIKRRKPESALIITHSLQSIKKTSRKRSKSFLEKSASLFKKIYQQTINNIFETTNYQRYLRNEPKAVYFLDKYSLYNKEVLLEILDSGCELAALLETEQDVVPENISVKGFWQKCSFDVATRLDQYTYMIPYQKKYCGYPQGTRYLSNYFSGREKAIQPLIQVPLNYDLSGQNDLKEKIALIFHLKNQLKQIDQNGGLLIINIPVDFLKTFMNRIYYKILMKTLNKSGLPWKKIEDIL